MRHELIKLMRMPRKIFVYPCDYETDGKPILAVATMLEDLPEDSNGMEVGEYQLIAENKFEVKRQLQPRIQKR